MEMEMEMEMEMKMKTALEPRRAHQGAYSPSSSSSSSPASLGKTYLLFFFVSPLEGAVLRASLQAGMAAASSSLGCCCFKASTVRSTSSKNCFKEMVKSPAHAMVRAGARVVPW